MRTLQNVLRKSIHKEVPLSPEDILIYQESNLEPTVEGITLLTESCRKYLSDGDWLLLSLCEHCLTRRGILFGV